MTNAQRTSIRERPGRQVELPETMSVVFSDIPDGMTLGDYRRSRPAPRRRRGLLRRW